MTSKAEAVASIDRSLSAMRAQLEQLRQEVLRDGSEADQAHFDAAIGELIEALRQANRIVVGASAE